MNSTKRQVLKPKTHCGEHLRQVAVPPPQRTDLKSTRIKRKNDDDSDHQPPNKKVLLSNRENNKSKLTKSNATRNESRCNILSKSHELSTPNYRIPKITSASKFSANDRLKMYRQCLEDHKEEVIKVHSILKSASPKHESNNTTVPKSYDRINTSSRTIESVTSINKTLKIGESATRINSRLKTGESARKINNSLKTGQSVMRINNSLETPESVTGFNNSSKTAESATRINNNNSRTTETVTKVNNNSSRTTEPVTKVNNKSPRTAESVKYSEIKSSTSSSSVQERLLKAKRFSNSQSCGTSPLKATSSNECNVPQISKLTNKTSGNDNCNLNFSSAKQPLDEDSDMDMEWSPIEVNEVVSDIQKLRQEMQINKEHDDRNKKESNEDTIYVVVDTNVFISHLNTIRDLINLSPYASKQPVVIVPWMVIQELDFFKDGRSESDSMRNSARRAVKFINDNLASKNQRLRGQTVQDALKQESQSSNPDDGILFCCLQTSQEDKPTVLLSNDVNLRNKALIHGISSHGTAEINGVLLGKTNQKNKGEQIISVFTRLCSHIIENEMKLAYGTVAKNLISEPPWSLKQCLIYFKRFWGSVFSLIIPQKQFVKILDDMMYFHTSRKDISSDEDVEQFTKLCFSMCVYFKNCLVKYKNQVQDCITHIEEIVS